MCASLGYEQEPLRPGWTGSNTGHRPFRYAGDNNPAILLVPAPALTWGGCRMSILLWIHVPAQPYTAAPRGDHRCQ